MNRSSDARLAAFVDGLQMGGRYSFTLEEARGQRERSDAATGAALRLLKQRGRIASPRRGFFVVVPLEYKSAGCPPASWFIDDLMRFMGQPYYVAMLSAAAIHGAAHQQPMVFQVMTDRATRLAAVGRIRIDFHVNRAVDRVPVVNVQTETGSMRVSTPAATAFDLVRYAVAAGQVNNVATALGELAEKLDGDSLVEVAPLYATPDVQRLGYLLEILGHRRLVGALWQWLSDQRHRAVPLVSGQQAETEPDQRWKVFTDENVEPDL